MSHAVPVSSIAAVGYRRPAAPPWLRWVPLGAAATLVCILVLTPVLLTLVMSLKAGLLTQGGAVSLHFYQDAWSKGTSIKSLLNTLAFAAGTTLVALLFGVPLAFLAERTDFKMRGWLFPLMTVKLVMPVYITAMAWILLMSPKIGLINTVLMGSLHLSNPPFSIYSLGGMALVQGLSLASVSFFMLTAVFRAMDVTLEEAAQASGVNRLKTFLRVDLPLALPGLLGAAVYIFMIGMGSFEVPAIIGMPQQIYVLSTELYTSIAPESGLPNYNTAAAFGAALLIAGLLLMYGYWKLIGASRRYAVVTGHGYKTAPMRLGKWQPLMQGVFYVYFALALVMPFLALLWISLSPYVQPVSVEAIESLTFQSYSGLFANIGMKPVLNTLLLILVAPICSIALSFAVAWIVTRTRFRLRSVLDTLSFLPHATSSTLMAVAFSFAFLSLVRVAPIYGSIWSLVIVMTVMYLPFATRSINATLMQIHPDLEEVGRVSGIRTNKIVRRVLAPLIAPVLLNGWIWLWLLAYREVTVPVVLSSPKNEVLSTTIWRLWRTADFGRASALGVVVILVACVLVLVARKAIARAAPAVVA